MILIAALDDRGGMMFNKRRQSQDALLRERILALTAQARLCVNSYTASQFSPTASLCTSEDPLGEADDGAYCFIEDLSAAAYEEKLEKLVIYRWNRTYPADKKFDIDLSQWKLQQSSDFAGKSHEKITEEVYLR